MATSIDEYRQRLYEDITVPSGAVFTIRAVWQEDFLSMGELPLPRAEKPGEDQSALPDQHEFEQLRRYTEQALVKGVVRPPLTAERDDGGQPVLASTTLHVLELMPGDYAALTQAILRKSGLVAEVAADVDAFRQDPERPADSGPGGEVPSTPIGHSETDAGRAVPGPDALVSD